MAAIRDVWQRHRYLMDPHTATAWAAQDALAGSDHPRVILSTADIRAIFCNGKTSWNYYRKYQESATGIPAVSLPSTSPANAAWTLEKLEGAWGIITDYLK